MRLALALWLLTGGAAAAAAPLEVAPGVYVIIHPDATEDWPNGNTTIVVGERGVLVVDAGYLPSVARSDIALVRKLSKRPVRWLVNTHWHYDHTDGDIAYREAFPDVEIVVSAETRRLIEANVPRWVHAAVAPGSTQRKALAELKAKLPAATGADKTALEANIRAREQELTELAAWRYAAPTTVFSGALDIDLGGRLARVLCFGRGNTPGDTLVHLPAEQIVITGDLVVAPVPFAFYSFPAEWIVTLGNLRALGATTIIPGHGAVMKGDDYVAEVTQLLESTTRQVAELAAAGKTADEARKAIDLQAFHKSMVESDPAHRVENEDTWQNSILGALVDRAWLWARGGL
jgi:cyclase